MSGTQPGSAPAAGEPQTPTPPAVAPDEPQGAPDEPAVVADESQPATGRRSGLRNPAGAARGLGAGTLVVEALVLLLAIQPIRVLGGQLSGTALTAVIVLAGVAVVLAGMMGRAWAWHVGTALQGLLLLSGVLHWSLTVLGVIFSLVWAYVLHVRRVILR